MNIVTTENIPTHKVLNSIAEQVHFGENMELKRCGYTKMWINYFKKTKYVL